MDAPDVSAFECVPSVGADSNACLEEPRLHEESKIKASYDEWDGMAKVFVLVFGCLCLANLHRCFVFHREMASFVDYTTAWKGGEEKNEGFVIIASIVNDEAVFQQYLKKNRNAFVAFNAPWSLGSQKIYFRTRREFAAVVRNSVVRTVLLMQIPKRLKFLGANKRDTDHAFVTSMNQNRRLLLLNLCCLCSFVYYLVFHLR
jgi:hypothetical protein